MDANNVLPGSTIMDTMNSPQQAAPAPSNATDSRMDVDMDIDIDFGDDNDIDYDQMQQAMVPVSIRSDRLNLPPIR